jgi:hypothetical protein
MEEGECGIKRQREGGGGKEGPTNYERRPIANRHAEPAAAASPREGQDDKPAEPCNEHGPQEVTDINKVGALSRGEEWRVAKRGVKGTVCE